MSSTLASGMTTKRTHYLVCLCVVQGTFRLPINNDQKILKLAQNIIFSSLCQYLARDKTLITELFVMRICNVPCSSGFEPNKLTLGKDFVVIPIESFFLIDTQCKSKHFKHRLNMLPTRHICLMTCVQRFDLIGC